MEIAIKINIGKLPNFNIPLGDFIKQTESDGFKILPIDNTHLIAYTSLPIVVDHKDPSDRLLIAISKEENMKIVTVDEKFNAYGHLIDVLYERQP